MLPEKLKALEIKLLELQEKNRKQKNGANTLLESQKSSCLNSGNPMIRSSNNSSAKTIFFSFLYLKYSTPIRLKKTKEM